MSSTTTLPSSPSRGQTSTPTPRSVASGLASANRKDTSASSVTPDPMAASTAAPAKDDGYDQGHLLSSAELASYKLPSSPLPNPPARGQSDQMVSNSHSHSSLQLQDSLQAQMHNAQAAGPPSASTSLPSLPSSSLHSKSQSHHQAGAKPFPRAAATTTLQDQKPITTVSIQSPASSGVPSTPTSPLVHTLHAKPFTPSKPPNLAAAPFVPSSATTPPTTTLAASLLTNPGNAFVLTSVPRQQAYVSPSKSTSPTRTNTFMVTTSTQYPSPDPSPRSNTVLTPPMSIKPTAPLTPTPARATTSAVVGGIGTGAVATSGLTPPRSPTATRGKSQVNPQLQQSSWTHAQGDKRDVFGRLAHQLSSLDVKVGAGETKEEREAARLARAAETAAMYAEQQPVLAMAAEAGPMALMPVPPPTSYNHLASYSVDRPVKGEPDACLFVASLNAQRTDEQLTESVTKHFAKWGDLMGVKVMKDWMNRPYAFVQYRLVADAQRAIEESHDTVVDGRHVRVEAARVNRTLFLSKLPKTMSDDILHQFMSKWGKVEDVTLVMNQLTGRPKGCAFAKFRYREDAIRAYLHIRQQGKWGVEWAANLEKNKPETDRSSIFVGQLNPDEATEAAVRARFATYGTLENVHLIVADGEAFAFIKYDDETGSQLAINNENGKEFQGSRILVQYRESPEGKSPMVRRPLGREPKPLTRPQSNKPATFISPSAGYVLTRPSIESGRTVSVDSSTQLEDLNSIKESAPQQQQQHQQQQQQQHGAASNPHRLHGSTNLFPTGGNPPSGPSVSSGAPTYYSHLPNIPTMHQHGYLPYYPPPYMYGGYYGYHPGYYPPPHMPHHHPHHHHGGCYPPPPAHQRPHMYHGYPPNIPYGDLSHSQQQHHHQLGTVQEVSGGAGQSLQLQGYPGTQQDAYHAAIQEHLANASATSGTNTGGGASGGGGGFSGAMYDSFYGGVGYPPMDPSAANTDLVRHFATSSPAPIRVPTTPYPIVQAQQHPPEFPSPPAAAATSDSKSGSTLSGHVPPSSTAVPKSLFSTLTASAAAGRAEHLESMYTQSLKSALVGLSSADVANTPLASVVALSSATSGVAPLPPTLGPRSSSTNVEAPAEGSLGGGVGATGASGSGSGTPAALTTGFGNAFGSALFPPFAPGTSATVGERTGSAATRGGGGNAAVGKRGSPESLVAGIVESGNATYASW